MFLPIYTFEEIHLLQREDADLGILHDWMDKSYQPSRDEVAAHSPAVRKYWLNSENIDRKMVYYIREDGISVQQSKKVYNYSFQRS